MPNITAPMPQNAFGGQPEGGARPASLDPTRKASMYPRGPEAAAAADKARQEKYGNRGQNSDRLTRPQTVVSLAHDWAVPVALVQRLMDVEAENLLLKADLQSVYDRLNKLEKS